MKTKVLILLGVILITLLAIVFLREKHAAKKEPTESPQIFAERTKDTCGSFQITDLNGFIKIKRTGDRWVVAATSPAKKKPQTLVQQAQSSQKEASLKVNPFDDYPAYSAAVDAALKVLQEMRMDDLISQNPEKQKLFEVDSMNGTLVEVFDAGDKLIKALFIGKCDVDGGSYYVRVKGTNDVYHVEGDVKSPFFTEVTRWRDHSVLIFDWKQANKITLAKHGNGAIAIEKSIDTADTARKRCWTITAPVKVKADSGKTEDMILEAANLTTNIWEESPVSEAAMGFTKPWLVITVALDNGAEKIVTVGSRKNDAADPERWVKSSEKKGIYFRMLESRFKKSSQTLEDFRYKAPVKKDSSATTIIKIEDKKSG